MNTSLNRTWLARTQAISFIGNDELSRSPSGWSNRKPASLPSIRDARFASPRVNVEVMGIAYQPDWVGKV